MSDTAANEPLDDDLRAVLGVFERHAESPRDGMLCRLLSYRLRQLPSPPDEAGTLARLSELGLIEYVGSDGERVVLTTEGYVRVLALSDEAPAPAEAGPRRGPTEYGLRRAVLDIFAEFEVDERGELSAGLLRSFWSSSGRRAGELRHALDLLMRDRYLRLGRLDRTVFRLQDDGLRYLQGREAPAELIALAPRAYDEDRYIHSVPDGSLLVLTAQVFRMQQALPPRSLSYGEVVHGLSMLDVPEFQHFHACELLHRIGAAEITDPEVLRFELTDEGLKLVQDAGTEMLQWAARLAINDAQRSGAAHD